MRSTRSLAKQLQRDFTDLSFTEGDTFFWAPDTQTIAYQPSSKASQQHLLHELAHALLEHKEYNRDIQLIDMERAAWVFAKENLSPQYDIEIDHSVEQSALDSYRDWMHARSTCPSCRAIGVETTKNHYQCPACNHAWRVNEARICGLKRYSTKK